MKALRSIAFLLFVACFATSLKANPDWEIKIEPSPLVELEKPLWHERGDDWLFTSRLVTSLDRKLKPMVHLAFTAIDAEENEIWVYRKSIRKDKLNSRIGGLHEFFVRAHLKEVPDETEMLKIEFFNKAKGTAEKEAAAEK